MKKKSIIMVPIAIVIVLLCMIRGSDTTTDIPEEPKMENASEKQDELKKETVSEKQEELKTEKRNPEEDNQYYYVERFIEKYNEISDYCINVTTKEIREDKRLPAYDNSPVVYGQIGDAKEGVNNISVMRYWVNSYFEESRVSIRFSYCYDHTLELPKNILESVVKVMDSSITDEMIQKGVYDNVNEYGEVTSQYIKGDNCEICIMISTLPSGLRELYVDGSVEK